MDKNTTIKAIDAYAKKYGLLVTTVGQLSVQNRNAYDRIKSGTAHRDTEERILSWIDVDTQRRESAQVTR